MHACVYACMCISTSTDCIYTHYRRIINVYACVCVVNVMHHASYSRAELTRGIEFRRRELRSTFELVGKAAVSLALVFVLKGFSDIQEQAGSDTPGFERSAIELPIGFN